MKKTISILIILCVAASLFALTGSVRFAPSISMPVSLGAVYYF